MLISWAKPNDGLSIDSTTKLLEYKLNSDYFNINASNQLSPVFEIKGIQSNTDLSVDTSESTKLLKLILNNFQFLLKVVMN